MRGAGIAIDIKVSEGNLMVLSNSSGEKMQSEATAKKPYQKPGFRFERVFVTSALTCGKISPTDLGCTHAQAS
jgi:hypothetical protein